MQPDHTEDGVARLLSAAAHTPPGDVLELLPLICELVGADAARFYVADYSLRRLQQIDRIGRVGPPHTIDGTLVGRTFTSGEVLVAGADPTTLSVPIVEGTNPLGVLQLDYEVWGGAPPELLHPIASAFAMIWLLKNRYSDTYARARRSEPLSAAAEVQWDLLPPLSCSTDRIAVSGILEPAYDIGGDSFDYAFDRTRLDFAIVDAVGKGLSAVLMSAAAINSLRNSRRAELDLATAYRLADRSIETQFGNSSFVTGIVGSVDMANGTLTWINAGHPPPMLVRNGTYAGTLACKPSAPLGLGHPVSEVAERTLQRGDRVLFFTDGITESRSASRESFGEDRLADFLVRATLERLPVQTTVRHLTDSIIQFNGATMRDDATVFLIEWCGATA